MNRRDILIFVGVIICMLFGYSDITSLSTSVEIINHFAFWSVILCIYLVSMIILSLACTRFGKWGDKKLFKE